MRAKTIYEKIKNYPHRDGEGLIKEYAVNFLRWVEYTSGEKEVREEWLNEMIEKFEGCNANQ